MVRLFGEDLWLARCDCELGFRDLEHLGIVQFPIIGAVAEGLISCQPSKVSHSRQASEHAVYVGSPVYSILISPQRQLPVGIVKETSV